MTAFSVTQFPLVTSLCIKKNGY